MLIIGCGLPAISLPPSQPPGSLRAQGHCGSKDSCILHQASALELESVLGLGSEHISLPTSHSPQQENTNLQWIPVNGKRILTEKKRKSEVTPVSNLHARSQATNQPPQGTQKGSDNAGFILAQQG